jgi:hypothetical protein
MLPPLPVGTPSSTSTQHPIITQPAPSPDSLQAKLVLLQDIFKQNSYNDWQIHTALNRHPHLDQLDNKPNSVTFLPFVGTIFNSIRRELDRYSIKSVGLPHMKLSSLLHPDKYHLGPRTPGFYRIP